MFSETKINELKLAELTRLGVKSTICRMFGEEEDCTFASNDPRDAFIWIEAVVKADPELTELDWFSVSIETADSSFFEDGEVHYETIVTVPEEFLRKVDDASTAAGNAAMKEYRSLGGSPAELQLMEAIRGNEPAVS